MLHTTMDSSHFYSPPKDLRSPDIENSFFRSWALRARGSEFGSASNISAGSKTPSTPISPKTRARSGARTNPSSESRFSDGHVHSVHERPSVRGLPATPSVVSATHLDRAASDRVIKVTRMSVDPLTPKTRSTSSSIAKRTLELMRAPNLPRPSITILDTKPERPARGGLVWKRQISGHWLEIRIGKKAEPDDKVLDKGSFKIPKAPSPTPILGSYHHDAHVDDKAIYKSSLSQPAPNSAESTSSDEKSKNRIIARTKRMLGLKSSSSIPASSSKQAQDPATAQTLNRASSALRDHFDKQKNAPSSGSTSTSNLSGGSIAGKPKHRRHIFRPSYRRQHTGHSSSSSVLRVKRGKPPVSTPNDECMYTGSDSQKYMRVELTEPNAPTYLPSEARRIGTPPLPGDGGKLRGFFFDYNAPRSAGEEQAERDKPATRTNTAPFLPRSRNLTVESPRRTSPRSSSPRLQRSDDDVHWFRVKVALDETEDQRDSFELNVPEHLPSSPLCPRHPKHKSGGKGICVYHGRNKTGMGDMGDVVGAGWR